MSENANQPPPAPELKEQSSPILDAFAPPPLPAETKVTAAAESVAARPVRQPLPRKVEHVDEDNFQQLVLDSNVPVVVDFYADWCGPCKHLAPMLDQFAREQRGVRVVKVNADQNQKLKQMYRIRMLPTVMVFQDGKAVAYHVGLPKIQKALGL